MLPKKKALSGAPKPPAASYVRDAMTSVGGDAQSSEERRESLLWCLNNPWANKDAGTIELIDQGGWHGWALWT